MTKPAAQIFFALTCLVLTSVFISADHAHAAEPNPRVKMVTNLGEMVIELNG